MNASLLLLAAAWAQVAQPPSLEKQYEQIAELRRAGKLREAALAFEQLADHNTESDLWQRALASAGAIYQWDLREPAKARELYDRVIAGRDDRRGVMPALVQRLQLERAELGLKQEIALALRIYAKRPAAEHAPWILEHVARLYAEELSDPRSAIARLEQLRRLHPESTYVDDAAFLEAGLLRKIGQARDALRLYEWIISTHEESAIVGSYDSVHLDDAYLERARVLQVELRDEAAAEQAYLELVEEVPLSVFVDDALFEARKIATARGDMKKALEYVQRLRKLRPDSRYL